MFKVKNFFPYLISMSFLKILQFYFKFDKWHVSPLLKRKYASDLIVHVNKITNIKEKSVAEIGCGLGSIVANINAKSRFGYDQEKAVIDAARFVDKFKRQKTTYSVFDFPNEKMKQKVDIIMMVNWIHNIPNDVMKVEMEKMFVENLNPGGMIITDSVDNERYKFFHDFESMFDQSIYSINCIGVYPANRKLYVIAKR